MHYTLSMAVSNRLQHLLNDVGSIILTVRALRRDLVEQLTSLAELSDQEPILILLEDLVDLDDIWMVQPLQGGKLTLEELLLGLVHLLLLYDLDCDNFIRSSVLSHFHMGK